MTTSGSGRGVEVLDLGLNNLASLLRALSQAGFRDVRAIDHGTLHRPAKLLVLPGVGAFGAAMDRIRERGFDSVLRDHLAGGEKVAGVCLGMQLLGTSSQESPGVAGLNLVPGEVVRLPAEQGERIPHVGWSGVGMAGQATQFDALEQPFDYYFIHSYALQPKSPDNVLAETPFGSGSFVSAVLSGDIVAFQFHPEKSSRPGARLLQQVQAWSNA